MLLKTRHKAPKKAFSQQICVVSVLLEKIVFKSIPECVAPNV